MTPIIGNGSGLGRFAGDDGPDRRAVPLVTMVVMEHGVASSPGSEGSANFDALAPGAIARKAEAVGVAKTEMETGRLFVLAVLTGAFISLGGLFFTVVTAGGGSAPGVSRLLGGVVFALGLVLVIVGGGELFTGNTLVIMAFASRRVRLVRLLRNWGIVYVGNAVGAVATAMLVVLSRRFEAGDGSIGVRALNIAQAKTSLSMTDAFVSGILANTLVCLAVWMSMSARSVTDKVIAVVPPVAALVAAGFEHSVANMYFVPVALFQRLLARAGFWVRDVDIGRAVPLDHVVAVRVPQPAARHVGQHRRRRAAGRPDLLVRVPPAGGR